jgi:ubiquitin carboxyl-terminal hydrolase 9/24
VLESEDPSYGKVKEDDNLLYQLKAMFIALKMSEKQAYNPVNFCQAFKDF